MVLIVRKLQSNGTEEINLMEPRETVFAAAVFIWEKACGILLNTSPKRPPIKRSCQLMQSTAGFLRAPIRGRSKTHRQQRNRENKNSPRGCPVPSASGEATEGRKAGGLGNAELWNAALPSPDPCHSSEIRVPGLSFKAPVLYVLLPHKALSSPPRPSDVGWTQWPGDGVSWSYSHRYKNPNSNSLRVSSPFCSSNNGNVLKARVRTAKGHHWGPHVPYRTGPRPPTAPPGERPSLPATGVGEAEALPQKAFIPQLRRIIPLSPITRLEWKLVFSGMLRYTESQNTTHLHSVFLKYHKILQYFKVEATEAEPWLTEGSWERNWNLSPTTKTLSTLPVILGIILVLL